MSPPGRDDAATVPPMSPLDETERSAFAYHEAGHAVLNLEGGISVDSIRIEDDHAVNDTSGLDAAELQALPREEYRRLAEPYLIALLAGIHAERRHTSRGVDGGSMDREDAGYLALDMVPDGETLQGYLDRMDATARAAVDEHWSAIDAVARRLLETG